MSALLDISCATQIVERMDSRAERALDIVPSPVQNVL